MEKFLREQIIDLVKSEVVPAVGCTEPIAVALCVAKAAEVLATVANDSTKWNETSETVKNRKAEWDRAVQVADKAWAFVDKTTTKDGKKIEKVKEEIHKTMSFEEAIEEMNCYTLFDMSANGKLFHRELFKDLRFPVGKLSEDFFVMPELFRIAGRVSYVSKPNYNYLQRKNSITKNKKINEDFLEAAEEQMKKLENKSEKLKIITHVAYASAALTVYDFVLFDSKDPKTLKNNR